LLFVSANFGFLFCFYVFVFRLFICFELLLFVVVVIAFFVVVDVVVVVPSPSD